MNGAPHQESTETASKEVAIRILRQRESEAVLGLFKVGWGVSDQRLISWPIE